MPMKFTFEKQNNTITMLDWLICLCFITPHAFFLNMAGNSTNVITLTHQPVGLTYFVVIIEDEDIDLRAHKLENQLSANCINILLGNNFCVDGVLISLFLMVILCTKRREDLSSNAPRKNEGLLHPEKRGLDSESVTLAYWFQRELKTQTEMEMTRNKKEKEKHNYKEHDKTRENNISYPHLMLHKEEKMNGNQQAERAPVDPVAAYENGITSRNATKLGMIIKRSTHESLFYMYIGMSNSVIKDMFYGFCRQLNISTHDIKICIRSHNPIFYGFIFNPANMYTFCECVLICTSDLCFVEKNGCRYFAAIHLAYYLDATKIFLIQTKKNILAKNSVLCTKHELPVRAMISVS
ncbi:hypothetical protein ACJX0J_022999 [Zea mays]